MFHSIISQYDIFFTNDIPKSEFRSINGGMLELTDNCGIKQVKRLYSTNPYLYLDKRYSPYSDYNGG